MARIIVCGYMIRHPVAGNILAYLHYVLGLQRLGHEVVYFEESGWANSCYSPLSDTYSDEPTVGIQIVRNFMRTLSVEFRICYVNRETRSIEGFQWSEAHLSLSQADLLLNVGGVCWLPEFQLCKRRALVDMDPFFTQVGRIGVEGDYHVYFSYGANIGTPGCTIPTNGIRWWPTVPPVVPEIWSDRTGGGSGNFTGPAPFSTVANWSAYGDVTYQGESYGQKDREFLRFLGLPTHVAQEFEIALAGAGPRTREQFLAAGWRLKDGADINLDLAAYQSYICNSRGEFSTAKNAYVKTNSGWFSDRTVCYLAAGRPAILQDCGFSKWLPVGRGVLAFRSLDEAIHCIEQVNSDYSAHCRSAREIAEQTFGYRNVLTRIVELAMAESVLTSVP